MNHHDENDLMPALAWLLATIAWIAVLLLLGGFMIAVWLSRQLFQRMLIPWYPSLEKHDGLVIIISGCLWSLVFGLGIFPLLLSFDVLNASPDLMTRYWLDSFAAGGIWGIAVATCMIIVWWEEIKAAQPQTPLFAEMVGVDPAFFQPTIDQPAEEEVITLEDLEAEFAKLAHIDMGRSVPQVAMAL